MSPGEERDSLLAYGALCDTGGDGGMHNRMGGVAISLRACPVADEAWELVLARHALIKVRCARARLLPPLHARLLPPRARDSSRRCVPRENA